MRIEFHPRILEQQVYRCTCCGASCRSFLVAVEPRERQAIEALADWRARLGVDELFVRRRAAGRAGYGLAKRLDGRCVFLDDDNLCLIHKLHGLPAKPLACQLYPFVLTPLAGKWRVGLRFDCPAVVENVGVLLTHHEADLRRLEKQLATPRLERLPAPPVAPARRVSNERFEAINEALVKIITSDATPLVRRLLWLHGFAGHVGRIRWDRVSEEDFQPLLNMLRGGVLAEVQRAEPPRRRPEGRPRKLLGQIFFLLGQPTTVLTGKREGLAERLGRRWALLRAARQFRRAHGPLPKIRPTWPKCDLSDLEHSFGDWPAEVQQMLTRYLTSRLAGMNYCGPAFYGYGMIEGLQTLLLGMVAVGWLMRLAAVRAGRRHLELADAHEAVLTIDGNLGYAEALNFGPARLRLRVLGEHLGEFIACYCS